MKNKRYILYFILIVSMVMLIAPVVPHHHHSNGVICMKDDIKETECPCHHQHHHESEDDPCCTNDCMAVFESSVPVTHLDEAQPQYFYSIILFTEPLLRFITQPEGGSLYRHPVYLESLHGTYIACAAGLRAPPYLTI